MADLFNALLPFERIEEESDEDEEGADEVLIGPDGEEIFPEIDPAKPIKVAIVGRPNAGKVDAHQHDARRGEERLLTGPEAGITRDSISVDWVWRDPPASTCSTPPACARRRASSRSSKSSRSAMRCARSASPRWSC